jgi:hypothetical protein
MKMASGPGAVSNIPASKWPDEPFARVSEQCRKLVWLVKSGFLEAQSVIEKPPVSFQNHKKSVGKPFCYSSQLWFLLKNRSVFKTEPNQFCGKP